MLALEDGVRVHDGVNRKVYVLGEDADPRDPLVWWLGIVSGTVLLGVVVWRVMAATRAST